MKAILEFDLPEENNEYRLATNGSKYYNTIWDISQWIRNEIKYNNKDYCVFSEAFYNILEVNGVVLDEIE